MYEQGTEDEPVQKIPNIVHYIWFSPVKNNFSFLHMLSILSVHKIVKPKSIFFHTNNPPHGKYWDQIVGKITVIKREVTYSKTLKRNVSKKTNTSVKNTFDMATVIDSDHDRIAILTEVGGIYLDLDVLAIRSPDELLKYDCVLGRETPGAICCGVILASNTSLFLRIWLSTFVDNPKPDNWAHHCCFVPVTLYKRYPELLHVEEDTILRPNWGELGYIIGPKRYNWHKNYFIHTYHRLWADKIITPESIKKMNNTFGQITRFIYYGSERLL